MAIAADRPGAASAPRAVTLRIKRGAKLLSDVKIGRSRVVVGGGKTAQLRLKNAGLADECLVIDTRTEPFGIESKLGPDEIRVNGRPMLSSNIRIGDVIEMSGLTLELVDGAGAPAEASSAPATERDVPPPPPRAPARAPPVPPATRPPIRPAAPPPPEASAKPLPEEAIDPYLGRLTAAKVSRDELDRERARRVSSPEAPAAARGGQPGGTAEPVRPPARPVIPPRGPAPAPPAAAVPPEAAAPTRASARPPWIELVGDDQVAEARLYLQDGTTAGRQGDVRVRHPSVSKKHAKFSIVGGRLFVEDLGSTNGVWINRERITVRSPLAEGDTLHLGAVEFTVRVPAPQGAEVTNFAGAPEPSVPTAARLADAPTREPEPRSSPSVVPQAKSPRELRTENEGVPSGQVWEEEDLELESDPRANRDRGTERELPASQRKRPTEREQRSPLQASAPRTEEEPPAARKRPTEKEQRSPFAEEEIAPTGTGRPGRRDRTEREIAKSEVAARLNAPPTTQQKGPTPSMLFGDVEDLSEKYSFDKQPEPPARGRDRAPARTTVRPPEPFTGELLREDDFVPPRRRSAGKMMAVAFLGFLFGGVVVGGLALWPRIAALLEARPAGIADAGLPQPEDGRPGAVSTSKPSKDKGTGKTAATNGGKRVDAGGKSVPRATPEVGALSGDVGLDGGIPEDEGPKSIFDDEPVDLSSGGRLDKELASLEKDAAEKGLRAERTIGNDELKSIFLGESQAVVRKYADDGFTQAPSAADADPRDVEARRQGAKQIDPNKVNAMIREKFPAVKRCLVGASVKRGKARVVVEFTIQPSGKPENVSVVESDIPGSSFKGCVAGVVRGIRFPKTKDQSVVVQFPFVFTYN